MKIFYCFILLFVVVFPASAMEEEADKKAQSQRWLNKKKFTQDVVPQWPIKREQLVAKVWVKLNKKNEKKKNALAQEIITRVDDSFWGIKSRLLACVVILGANPVQQDTSCPMLDLAQQHNDANFVLFLVENKSIEQLFVPLQPGSRSSVSGTPRAERKSGKYLLHTVMSSGHSPTLVQWCLDHGFDPNETNKDGVAPLQKLILTSQAQTKEVREQKLEILINAGANLSQVDSQGRLPDVQALVCSVDRSISFSELLKQKRLEQEKTKK